VTRRLPSRASEVEASEPATLDSGEAMLDIESATAVNTAADPIPPWDSRHDRRALLGLFLIVWVVYLVTANYGLYQMNDNRAVATSAWRLATAGTLALPADWEGDIPWETRGVDGRLYTDRFPGVILVAAPAYAVADALGMIDRPTHAAFVSFAPASATAATIAALAVAVLFAVFRRLADRRTALLAAGLFAFGTASWSVSGDAMWTHGVTSLGLALGMLFMARGRGVAAGAGYALSILARPQTAIVPAVVGLWCGVSERSLRSVVAVGLTSSLGLLAVIVYSRTLFGTWLPVAGYDPVKVEWVVTSSGEELLERLAMTLVNPVRGVLVYTPVLLLLVPFVHRGWRSAPGWVRSSAVAGVLYLVLQLRANSWEGGYDYFGSRLTIETLVLTSPLFLCVWQELVAKDRILRTVFFVLAGISLAVHLVGATVLSYFPSGGELRDAYYEELCSAEDAPVECDDLDLPSRGD
jgi:hypothetical protein